MKNKKITLNDLANINHKMFNESSENIIQLHEYVELIKEYIDDNIFKNDILIKKLAGLSKETGRIFNMRFNSKIELAITDIELANYLNECKLGMENSLFVSKEVFDMPIFIEIISIAKYYSNSSYELDGLKNHTSLYSVKQPEFHKQNETFKYLYSAFDKLTYIAKHLNSKYLENSNENINELTLKFYSDFHREISFLTKSEQHSNTLREVIEMITQSTAWHFIRKLRNQIEHDFIDPSFQYNISLSIELLFIIIARVLLSLKYNLLDKQEIAKKLQSLKDKNSL